MQVTGLDVSPAMLSQARERIRAEGLASRVTLLELGAVDLDREYPTSSFDAVTSTIVFSELSDDEIDYVLAECRRILRPGGRLLIADEVMPGSALGRLATFLVRLPFVLLAFVLTQNTTHRVAGLDERIRHAGLILREDVRYLAGTLQLYIAEKVD
jgi:demethylmenaquinone methyltransferase/2-methoxy-6-polyprenyl-1,4-benzoquinol methylase